MDLLARIKSALLDNTLNTIIIRRALPKRWCWNWQTGMVEGHVSKDVEVQVLSSAHKFERIPEIIRGFLYARQREVKCCAFAQFRFNPDTTAMHFDDSPYKRQPDSGTFSFRIQFVK